jgi:hypothetical protein
MKVGEDKGLDAFVRRDEEDLREVVVQILGKEVGATRMADDVAEELKWQKS